MSNALEVIGLALAFIDFFGITPRLERIVDRFRRALSAELRRYHFFRGGYMHWPTIYSEYRGRFIIAAFFLTIIEWGVPLIIIMIVDSESVTSDFIISILVIGVLRIIMWPLLFFTACLFIILTIIIYLTPIYIVLHVLNIPRAGIVGTFGLVIAVIGFLLNHGSYILELISSF